MKSIHFEIGTAGLRTGLVLSLLVLTTGTATAQDTTEDVTAACLAGSNMPQAICDCVGENSAEFQPEQRAFYVASLTGESAEAERLRGELEFIQLSQITTFMRTAPADCAG